MKIEPQTTRASPHIVYLFVCSERVFVTLRGDLACLLFKAAAHFALYAYHVNTFMRAYTMSVCRPLLVVFKIRLNLYIVCIYSRSFFRLQILAGMTIPDKGGQTQ